MRRRHFNNPPYGKPRFASGSGRALAVARLLVIACLALPTLAGCHVLSQAKRTTKYEHQQFPYFLDRRVSHRQYRAWASEAWGTTYHSVAGDGITTDFRRGFFDGFADYCYAGGSGEPPLVPPRYFWSIRYRNDAGDQRIEDWRRGFRLGTQAANEGGYRKRATVPATVAASETSGTEYLSEENWDQAWDPSWDDELLEVLPLPSDEPAASDGDGVILEAPTRPLSGPEARRTTPHEPNLIGQAKRDVRKRGGASR